ncbi:MAG: hypothetical protein HY690_07915 [Chloroflexi bacterium]|nr:hypothetical protein [Chloroflexota bacterium]
MPARPLATMLCLAIVLLFGFTACAPAAPAPTVAPQKPAPTAAPATQAPAPKPAATAAAKPAATAAAKPAATTAPAPKPTEKTAAKPAFDEQAIAAFYKGKTIKIIVGSAAGGGYDQYARAIARYFGKHIPGNPSMIVENMTGAGNLIAVNYLYNAAPKDGTVIGHYTGNMVKQQLFGAPGAQFDAARFNYLGAPMANSAIMVVHKRVGVTTPEQIMGPSGKEVIVGGMAPGSMTDDAPAMVRDVLGARLKLVPGYSGTTPIRLAMDQGEVDALYNSWESIKVTSEEQVRSGEYVALLQVTEKRHRDLPNAPTVIELARTDEQRQLLRAGQINPDRASRPFVAPPGVPPDRVEALRAAFSATMQDKEFLAEADKAKMIIEPVSADDMKKLVEQVLATPADLKPRLQKILAP